MHGTEADTGQAAAHNEDAAETPVPDGAFSPYRIAHHCMDGLRSAPTMFRRLLCGARFHTF